MHGSEKTDTKGKNKIINKLEGDNLITYQETTNEKTCLIAKAEVRR